MRPSEDVLLYSLRAIERGLLVRKANPGNERRFRLSGLHPAFLILVVALLAVPVALTVVDVPGESKIKDLLGISVLPAQGCGEVRHAGGPGGPWRAERPLAGVRDEARAARVGNGIYLVGGITALDLDIDPATATSVDTFERYDVKTGRYTSLPPLPARLSHLGVTAYRGDIYVVGGLTDQLGRAEATGDAWRYRPAEEDWEAIEPMPTPRGGHGLDVIGDRMYAVGGRNPARRLGTVEVYDFRTGEWSEATPMPTPRDHVGVAAYDGKIYAAGGRQDGDYSLGAFERYDPRADRWTRLSDLSRPASSFELVPAAGRLVAAGGGDSDVRPYWVSGQTWAYDPRDRKWSQLARMPQPKHGPAAAAVDGRVYLFGGSRCGAFRATDTAESLQVPPAGS